MRILLVDDDAMSLRSLNSALKLHGFEVDAFENPLQAFECFREKEHALVLSDLMMPELSGIQLLEKVKALNPHSRFVLFTGFYTAEKYSQAKAAGAHLMLMKPLSIQMVLELAIDTRDQKISEEV
ncbi:MAG: response regulator [FCB group bacterium]|nr:response regulator [FCB group bacterium]MBL7027854.1 response regulator [Candidatus Neomarinimicrobiota bacterium]MBL7120935.1 response regulator [Candidatus Neomarinimicrobiota bacterium]